MGMLQGGHGMKPHRIKSFKLSNDKRLGENVSTSWSSSNPQSPQIILTGDERS